MTEPRPTLPNLVTPEELARHTGWSKRRLRELARKIGACRIIGNRMLFTQADIDAIMEAARPEPKQPPSDGAYEKLQKMLAERDEEEKERKRKARGRR